MEFTGFEFARSRDLEMICFLPYSAQGPCDFTKPINRIMEKGHEGRTGLPSSLTSKSQHYCYMSIR